MLLFIFPFFVLWKLGEVEAVKVIPRCAKAEYLTPQTFQTLVDSMYTNDPDKPGPQDIHVDTTNWYGLNKLFHVNQALLTKPSYRALLNVLNVYYGDATASSWDEVFDPFLDAMLGSVPFGKLAAYFFACGHPWFTEATGEDAEGKEISRKDHIKAILKDLWFTPKYSGGGIGLRAFTHVFVGEVRYENNEASGLHSWLAFYYRERLTKKPVVFTGTSGRRWFDVVSTVAFEIPTVTQQSLQKAASGMLTITSPAFDFALYTAAVMFHGSAGKEQTKVTPVTILDCKVEIIHALMFELNDDIKIRTAYPVPAFDPSPWPNQCKKSYDERKTCPEPLPADGA